MNKRVYPHTKNNSDITSAKKMPTAKKKGAFGVGVYLDYGATTPVDREVLKEMLPYFSEKFGNAMSIHTFGQVAQEAVDTARSRAAKFFGCSSSEIIFTSGATESNNLVVRGALKSYYSKKENAKKIPHIITTAFEHHCVLDACKAAEKEGLAEVTFVRPDKSGLIRNADIKKALKPNTILVSVMYVNNEIGTVQPVSEIAKVIRARRVEKNSPYPIFHTDATQAIAYFDCNVQKLGVDLLSMSAHKIYGPKGIGLLFVKRGTPIRRIQEGGDQEYKLRAGTHNVPGIVGLGKAIELAAKNRLKDAARVKNLRDRLIKKIMQDIPGVRLNGSAEKRSPNNANFSFEDVEGEGLILALDMEGIAGSTGSACSSGALSPSHVLLSIGLKAEQAHGSLRLTLGKYTTSKDIVLAAAKIKSVISRLRKISGKVLHEYYIAKK